MGFFRDPESCSPIPGIRDRDFLFLARSKNPENPEIGDRDFEIPKTFRVKNPESPKIPGIGIYCSGISRSGGAQKLRDLIHFFGIFSSRDFYPRNFRKIAGLLITEISGLFGIFYFRVIPGIFYPRDRDIFRGMGYPDKEPPLILNGWSIKSQL